MNQQAPVLRTALYDQHIAAGGKLVDFAGWMLPVNYGSQIEEHNAVRSAVGMFDVSHMTIIDVHGGDAEAFLRRVVANDVAKLKEWGALYGALLNERGGVIDDLIVYFLPDRYRCVVNASTRDKVLSWFAAQSLPAMSFAEQDQAMIAVQGPRAVETLNDLWPGSVPDSPSARVDSATGWSDVPATPVRMVWKSCLHRTMPCASGRSCVPRGCNPVASGPEIRCAWKRG